MLTFTFRSLLLLSCIFMCAPLDAMKKRPTEEITEEAALEYTEEFDLSSLSLKSPEKKSRCNSFKVVNRTVKRLLWQEVQVAGSQLPTLHPYEESETVDITVDPLAHAVYYDNVDEVETIFSNPQCNISFVTPNILENEPAATILDIAAERRSYKCLAYFKQQLENLEYNPRLELLAVRALNPKDLVVAHQILNKKLVEEYRALPTLHEINVIKPKLCALFNASSTPALRISRKMGDIVGSQLLWDCTQLAKNS